jgi:hypothetical protein
MSIILQGYGGRPRVTVQYPESSQLDYSLLIAETIADNLRYDTSGWQIIKAGSIPAVMRALEASDGSRLAALLPACAIICDLVDNEIIDAQANYYSQAYTVEFHCLVPFDPLSATAYEDAKAYGAEIGHTLHNNLFLTSDGVLCDDGGATPVEVLVNVCRLTRGARLEVPRPDLKCALLALEGRVELREVPPIVPA